MATKEVELIGVSSGPRSAAGSLDFINSGAVLPAADVKQAET